MPDGYDLISSGQTLSAEEIARRNLARAAREEEIARRKREAARMGFGQRFPADAISRRGPGAAEAQDEADKKAKQELDDRIRGNMETDEFIASSNIAKRARARARTEELISKGSTPEEAEATARQEQADRESSFEAGRVRARSTAGEGGSGFALKEASAMAQDLVHGGFALGARLAGFEGPADQSEAFRAGVQAEMSQWRNERSPYPEIQGAVTGAATNMAQMVPGIGVSAVAGPGVGMAFMAGQFGTQEYSNAMYEGKEAGLAGDELNRYARIQGGIEASIMPIMNVIPGMKGLEGRVLRKSIARAVAENPAVRNSLAAGAKKLTKDTAAELTEEILTEVLHGVAKEKLLDETVDYRAVIKDTVLQTVLMMGMAEGAERAAGVINRKPQPPEFDTFLSDPSRTNYDAAVKAGMPAADPNSIKSRNGREAYAKRQRERFAEQQTAEAEQAAMQQQPEAAPQPEAAAQETPPGMVPNVDRLASILWEEGDPNEIQGQRRQGQQGDQGGQGLLNQEQQPERNQQAEQGPAANQEAAQPDPHNLKDAFKGIAGAISDNYYDAIYQSITSTGDVPPQEKRSSVGKAWASAKAAGASAEDFIAQLRGGQQQPAPLSRQEFEKQYADGLKKLQKSAEGDAYNQQAAVMAGLHDQYPEWADVAQLRTELAKDKDFKNAARELGVPVTGDKEADLEAIAENTRAFRTVPDLILQVTQGVPADDVFDEGDKYIEEVIARMPQTKHQIPVQRISEAFEAVLLPGEDEKSQTAPDLSPEEPSPDQPSPSTAGPVSASDGERQFVSGIPGAANINKQLGVLTGDIKPSPDLDADTKLLMLQESEDPDDARSRMSTMGIEIVSEHKSTGALTGNPNVNFTIKLTDDKGPLWAIVADHGMRPTSGVSAPKVVGSRFSVTHVSRSPMGPVTQQEPEKPKGPRQGEVGMSLSAGEVVKTSSGRLTTPFPKISGATDRKADLTMKRVNVWLHANALAEAESRGDDYNATMFRGETNPATMPQASKYSMEEYLFGEQPKVVPSILKDLAPKKETKPAAEAKPQPAPAKPTKTLSGQYLLPGEDEFRANEIDRNEFVNKHQARYLDRVRDEALEDDTVEAVSKPFDKILRAVWNGEIRNNDDLFDSDAWTELSAAIALNEPSRQQRGMEESAVEDIERAMKHSDALRKLRVQLDSLKEAHEEAKQLEDDRITPAGLEELVRRGQEDGIRAAQAGEEYRDSTAEEADAAIDSSIDLGTDALRVGDVVVKDGKTAIVEKVNGDGTIDVQYERRTDNIGRPISPRFSDWKTRENPKDFRKTGSVPYPSTIRAFYATFKDKPADEIKSEFSALWDSLGPDDKGRFAYMLRHFGATKTKANSVTGKLAERIADLIVRSEGIPGKIREIYDILNEYKGVDLAEDPELAAEATARIDAVDITLPGMERAAIVYAEEERKPLLHGYLKKMFGEDIADSVFDESEESETAQEEPSQEDLMEQILREELLGEKQPAQEAAKPKTTPKTTPSTTPRSSERPKKTRTEKAAERKKETRKEMDDAEDEFGKAFGSTAPMGLSPEQMRASARLVRAALNHGVSQFNEFVAYVVDRFGEPIALKAAEGIELAWRTLKRLPEYAGIDDAGKVADVIAQRKGVTGGNQSSSTAPDAGLGGSLGQSGRGMAPEAGKLPADGQTETGTGPADNAVSSGTEGTEDSESGQVGTESEGTGSEPGSGKQSKPGRKSSVKRGGKAADGVSGDVAGPRNLRIQPDDVIAPAGAITKLKANIAAVKLLKELQTEGRQATEAEQRVLMKYTGWGSLPNVFDENRGKAYIERPGLETNYGEWYEKAQLYKRKDQYDPVEVLRERVQNWERQWGEAYKYLKENLTPDEWKRAKASVLNAHFTSRDVITNGIWGALEHMGVTGGRFMEPSAGIGSLIGLMPEAVADNSEVIAIELDSLTGEMVKQLYPEADVYVSGFEDVPVPPGTIDVAATNVPFARIGPDDARTRYGRDMNLHNYFIARILDSLRPGGIAAIITTHFTMDANAQDRELLASKADLVGAIRLPSNAFKANAGTEVTTDIMFFRKPDGTQFKGEAWGNLASVSETTIKVPKGKKGKMVDKVVPITVNEYYANHPEMVLGTHSLEGTMYGKRSEIGEDGEESGANGEYTLEPIEGADINEQLRAAVANLPAGIATANNAPMMPSIEIGTANVEGRVEFRNGKLQEMIKGEWSSPKWVVDAMTLKKDGQPRKLKEETKRKKIAEAMKQAIAYTRVRNAYEKHLANMQGENTSQEDYEASQKSLNAMYDAYREAHGPLNAPGSTWLEADPGYFFTSGLEVEVEDPPEANGKPAPVTYKKADVFKERTVSAVVVPTKAETLEDAVKLSLAWIGSLNVGWMANLLSRPESDIRKELLESGSIFQDPATGMLEPADTYLSGNVHAKLRAAQQAVKDGNQEYARNVTSLMAVQPEKTTIDGIQPALGDAWIPQDLAKRWAVEKLEFPSHVEIKYNEKSDIWSVSGANRWQIPQDVQNEWGTASTPIGELLALVLNGQSTAVFKEEDAGFDSNGKRKTRMVLDESQTQANKMKAEKLRDSFEKWARQDETAIAEVERAYNEQKNFYVRTQYDGSHMTFPGMAKAWLDQIRPYQKNTIWRAIRTGRGMIAHGVGAGKTLEIIATAMELRRLGIARKPMIVVQNSTLGQFARTFNEVYPAAKVLVASKEDLDPRNRAKFMARIATGNWDAIVMAKSTFNEKVPNDPVREEALVEGLIAELEQLVLEQRLADGEGAPSVKVLEQQIRALRKRLKKLTDAIAARTDNDVYFEQMGVDALFLDEAHDFKKPPFVTKLDRKIKGISREVSGRALSALIKMRYVQDNNKGRNTFMATGTPITNTMGEAWLLMNMVAPDVLREFHVETFDKFVGSFARIMESLEPNAVNKLVRITRLGKFRNGHALGHFIQAGWDVLLGGELHDKIREYGGGKVPKLKDGKHTLHLVNRSQSFGKFAKFFTEVYDAYKDLQGEAKKIYSWIPVVIYGAAQAAAIDVRLVDPTAEDDPGSKLNTMIDGVVTEYHNGADQKLTQLIFSDISGRRDISSIREFAAGNDVRMEVDEDTDEETDGDEAEGVEGDEESGLAPEDHHLGGPKKRRKTDRWLYQEIRNKLIAKGIPEDQVQIVNDHNKTTESMLALQDKVRNGEVRIVIGHSDTLGTGVNVQPLLKHIWALDIPLVPAKSAQRDGRMIRSGNTNEEVESHVMAMQKSLDGSLMAMNIRKATFADQALMGKLGGEFDDPFSETLMSMADMQAAMNDDPLFYRQKELEHAVRGLKLDQEALDQQKSRERSRLRSNEWDIGNSEEGIAHREKTLEKMAPKLEGEPAMVVDGKAVKSLKEADALLKDKYKKASDSISQKTRDGMIKQVGSGYIDPEPANFAVTAEYGPVQLKLYYGERATVQQDDKGESYTEWTTNTGTKMMMGSQNLGQTGATTYSTLVSKVKDIPDGLRKQNEDSREFIKRKKAENEKLRVFLEKPFEHEAELKALEAELAQVTAQMYARDNPTEVHVAVTQEHMPAGYELVAPGAESKNVTDQGLPQKPSKKWHIVAPGGFSVGQGDTAEAAYKDARSKDPSRFPKLKPPAEAPAAEEPAAEEPAAETPADTMAPMTPARRAALKAREELRELQKTGLKYLKTIREEWDSLKPGGGMTNSILGVSVPLTREMAGALASYIGNSMQRGVKRFEIVIRDMRAELDESTMLGLKPVLIRTWNRFREEQPDLLEATSEGFDAAMQGVVDDVIDEAVSSVQGEEAKPTAPEEQTYSTKHAASAETREKLGKPPRKQPERQSRPESIDRAALFGATAAGARTINTLIAELLRRPRAVGPWENDLLNYRNAELGNLWEAALRRQSKAQASGDAEAQARAATEAAVIGAEWAQLVTLINEPIGTEAGRALQARKAQIASDFTLARMALAYQVSHPDATQEEQAKKIAELEAKIDSLNADMERLDKMLEEQRAKSEDLESRLKEAHDQSVSQQTQGPAAPEKRQPSTAERIFQDGKDQVLRGWSKLRAMKGKAYNVWQVPVDLADALYDIAAGYVKQGVVKLADFLEAVKSEVGEDFEKLKQPFTDAFNRAIAEVMDAAQAEIVSDLDTHDPDSIGRVARDLHSFVIRRDGLDASPEGREAAVAAVHEILAEEMPWISREEVARAMSGIGVYSPLSQDEIEIIRRDQKAQLLLLEQLADWKKGTPPPATGQERPPVSDEQRDLRRAVNEAKKEAGVVKSREGQLRSALDAAMRGTRNRIRDLSKALDSNKRIPANQKILKDDGSKEFAELTRLRRLRDELQQKYDDAFGRPELTDEQRVARAEKALDKAILSLESELQSGKLYNDARQRNPVTSPDIEAKTAWLDVLKLVRDELREITGEAQARSDRAYERMLKERDAKLAQRIADKDYAPRAKKPERKLTPEMLTLMKSIDDKKRHLADERRKWEFAQRHIVYKALTLGPVMGTAILRKALTTIDQSLIGRQGFLLGITHPKIYGKAIRNAFARNPVEARSLFPTEQDLFNVLAELDANADWVRMEKIAKLAVTDIHGGLRREEGNQFAPEWMNRIWGVGGSERAASAFINSQRRLVFRSLVEKLSKTMDGKSKTISNADLRVIGNLVNIASGRASVAQWSTALTGLATVFFSPNWWASRLAWWAGQPMWHETRWFGGEGASTEVRKLAAAEWLKQASAQAALVGVVMAGLTAAFGAGGDDEEWQFFHDPRAPKFGFFRIGRAMIDMTAGLGQHLSLLARLITGTQVNRWETEEADKMRLVGQYFRGKLAPVPAMFGDYLAGKSVGQSEFGSGEWVAEKLSPLVLQDVWKAYNEEDIGLASAVSMLMFFGIGAQAYDARMKARDDAANETRSMRKQGKSQAEIDKVMAEHLKNAAAVEARTDLRTADPEDAARLEKIAAGEDSPELADAIEKEKGDITLMASEMLSSEDPLKKKKADSDKSIENARALLVAIAPTFEEANRIYTEGYKRRNGSPTEVRGGQFRTKVNVVAARRRLKRLYEQ